MNYTLMINKSPYCIESSLIAYSFAYTLIKMNHTLRSVFFYSRGVLYANKDSWQFNNNLIYKWKQLSLKFNIKLYVCVKSALKQGIISHEKYKKNIFLEMDTQFKLVGLGVLNHEIQKCDRILQF